MGNWEMKILAVDNDNRDRKKLVKELQKLFTNSEIVALESSINAIQYVENLAAKGEKIEYAFLEINLAVIDGLNLATDIKKVMSDIKIIFCTDNKECAFNAYSIYAKGYLLKPVTSEKIESTLDEMVLGWKDEETLSKDIRVHTFGNFEVFVDDKPLVFEREKAKELLAYLIDRRGAAVTTAQIAAVLWENKEYDANIRNQTTRTVSTLRKALKQAGIEDILVKTWNHLAIDTKKIKCDIYDFEDGDSETLNTYHGEYMSNYSWAEYTNGEICSQVIK